VIGFYRHLVELFEASRVDDEAGGARIDWTPVEAAWAAVELLPTDGVVVAEYGAPLRRIAATMRWRPGLRVGDRLRFDGGDYDIVSIEAGSAARRMRLLCEEARP
jgi:head-tail adaptor